MFLACRLEPRYRPPHVLAQVPEAAIALDPAGTVVAVNDLLEDMFGYQAEHLVGGAVERLLRTREPLARIAGAVPARVKLEGRRANGAPFTVEVTVRLVGERLLCAVRELNHAALVDEAQRYFDVAFDNAPIGIALLNGDGEYVRVNSALCQMLGRTDKTPPRLPRPGVHASRRSAGRHHAPPTCWARPTGGACEPRRGPHFAREVAARAPTMMLVYFRAGRSERPRLLDGVRPLCTTPVADCPTTEGSDPVRG